MKKFNTPTISSVNKSTQDPAFLREKVHKLSSAVNELRHNVIQEDSYLENLQQSNMKNYNQLNSQLNILKKSFTQLSDILLSEITNLSEHFGLAVNQINIKVDNINGNVNEFLQIQEQWQISQEQFEQDIKQVIKINTNHDREIEALHNQSLVFNQIIERNQDKMRVNAEKLKQIQNNINNSNEGHVQNMTELKNKYIQINTNQNIIQQRIQDLQESLVNYNLDQHTKFNDLKQQSYQQKDLIRQETANTIKDLGLIVANIEDKMRLYDDNMDVSGKLQRQKLLEFETYIGQQYQEFQQDLQDLSSLYKDSSTQIIQDFEKTVNNNHNEIKYIFKKMEQLENKLNQYTDELTSKLKWK